MKIYKQKPRKRGESIEDYLSRVFTTEAEVIEYWKILTEELYNRNPKLVKTTLDTLKDINPEAYEIVNEKYLELKGDSN